MAIGIPVSLGSVAAGSASSAALNAAANIVAGDLVVVFVTIFNDTTTVSSISDGTNAYVFRDAISNPGNCRNEVWYRENAAAVTSPVITVNFAGSATTPSISAVRVTGIQTASSADQAAHGQGLASSFTAGPTATLAQANEIALGFSFDRGGTTQNVGTGFTGLLAYSDLQTATVKVDYQILSATAAVTFSGLLNSGGTNFCANVVTFKGLAAGTPIGATSFFDKAKAPASAANQEFAFRPSQQVPTAPTPQGAVAFVDRAPAPPSAAQQRFETFTPVGAIVSITPQGFSAFVDRGPQPPTAARMPFENEFRARGVIFSITPQGFGAFFDRAPAPPSAARMPFEAIWKFQVPTAITPQGWTSFFDRGPRPATAANMSFPADWKFQVPAPPVPRGAVSFFDRGPRPMSAALMPYEARFTLRPIPLGAYSKVAVIL